MGAGATPQSGGGPTLLGRGRWALLEVAESKRGPIVAVKCQVRQPGIQAERDLAAAQPSGKLTAEQVRALVDGLKDIPTVLAGGDPKMKAKLYEELGIKVRYDPSTRIVAAQSCPQIACATVRGLADRP